MQRENRGSFFMEFYERRNRTLFSFMEEDRKKKSRAGSNGRPPSLDLLGREISHQENDDHDHRLHQLQYSTSSMASSPHSAMLKLIPPRSPESPWTLSPMQTPSPSLLYHCIASLHRHEGNIQSIAISDGVVFTGSAQSSRIRAWKKPDCMERGYIKAGSAKVNAIEAYGNMLFTSHKDNRIRIWRFTTSEDFRSRKISSLPRKSSLLSFSSSEAHSQLISCLAYYHSEELLYTASHDSTVKAWRISDRKCVDSFRAHDDYINGVLVNQEDGCVFTCSSDGSVKIWRRVYKENSHTLTVTLKFQPSPVNAIALSSYINSVFLYAGSSDGTINFWEREKLTYRFNHGGFLQGHRFSVLCLEVIEKLVFSGSEDTTIRIWRREEGSHFHECLAVMDGHRGPVKCLAVCLEMEKVGMRILVYSGSLDQSFKVWRVKIMAENGEKSCGDHNSDQKMKMKMVDYEMSPVLSPSWVEKKIQGHPFH